MLESVELLLRRIRGRRRIRRAVIRRRRTGRRAACTTAPPPGPPGPLREGGLKHVLQLVGLVRRSASRSRLRLEMRSSIFDFMSSLDGLRAAGLIAGFALLKRRVDVLSVRSRARTGPTTRWCRRRLPIAIPAAAFAAATGRLPAEAAEIEVMMAPWILRGFVG